MEKTLFTEGNVKKIFTTPTNELTNVSPKIEKFVHGLDANFGTMAADALVIWGPVAAQPVIGSYLGSYKLAQVSAIHGALGNA